MQIENREMPVNSTVPATVSLQRRYDVDWLRVIALGLLIIYHDVISFMPWAETIGFPKNDTTLDWIWIVMAIFNVWRIPILFLVSGMGVRFAMERRDWKQLLIDRTLRILVPYIFGIIVLEYLVTSAAVYLGWDAIYTITFGHLWFLLNIFLYISWLFGIFIYLKDNPDNLFISFLSKLIQRRFGLFLLAIPIMLESFLTNPESFSNYAATAHGWIIGLLCFFYGFVFISIREVFWREVEKLRWIALGVAFLLYLVRLLVFKFAGVPNWLTGFESISWMLAIFGFGSLYFNKPSRMLSYLSKAVYPVYIVHMPVQFVVAYFILPLQMPAFLKLILLIAGTFIVSFMFYECLKRLKWIRPLFGMKLKQS